MSETQILLVDNGSYRPESTLNLRRIAAEVTTYSGHVITPISLLHSTKVDSGELNGTPAEICEPYLKKQYDQGIHDFVILPLFFGNSAAISEYLPQRILALQGKRPKLTVRIAPCMVDISDHTDTQVAEALAQLVRETISRNALVKPAVTLVDHGSPRIAVTKVRNYLANQLQTFLGDEASVVEASSMERRDGEEYTFNEPLLENILGTEGFDKDVVLSMLFISPGRHAGPGGDIESICAEAESKHTSLNTYKSELFATHTAIIPLLAQRLEQGFAASPIS